MNTKAYLYSKEYEAASHCILELEKKYEPVAEINSLLDRKLVSFQSNKSEPIFRWFNYREGFSKSLIEYIIDELDIPESSVLLDPFAGTGAAPFVAAAYRRMNGIAVELMPVGVFFIQCRNKFASLGSEKLIEYATKALTKSDEWRALDPLWKFEHVNITKGAFREECEMELSQFKTWLEQQEDRDFALFLDFIAFSILEKFSFTRKDGQYLRWDYRSPRFYNKEKKTSFDKGKVFTFREALNNKLSEVIDDLYYDTDLISSTKKLGSESIKVIQGSILEKESEIEDLSIDCVITSPPYCNRYDYTRTYALELAYLGCDESDFRNLRQTLLTCTVENKPKMYDWVSSDIKKTVDDVFARQFCLKKIIRFLESEIEFGRLNNKGIKTMVEGYFYDSTFHLAQMSKKLKQGGYYVMVNDNVRYNGLNVPVDMLLCEIASEFGLKTEKIWMLPKGKGNSSQQMKIHGRSEVRKCVYVWRKI